MTRINSLLAALLAGASMTISGVTQAKPFSDMVEFSGALSDTGNYISTHENDMPPPFVGGKTTNGMVAGEVVAEKLKLKVATSMHLVGSAKGSNYAVRDALAGGNGPDDLPAELDAYLKPRNGKADPDALYFVFNGGNDVIQAVMTPDDGKSEKILVDAVAGLQTAIHRLVNAGAKTLFVPDFVDIGLVPAMHSGPNAERASRISNEYNKLFYAMLDRVQSEGNVDIIRWSFDRFFKETIKHGAELGFTNTTDSCMAKMKAGECDLDHFLYVNEVFPTARFHRLMGEEMVRTILNHNPAFSQASN